MPTSPAGPLKPNPDDFIDQEATRKLEVAPEGAPVRSLPGPLGYIGERVSENLPDILGMIATALIPGGTAGRVMVGPLARIAAGATTAGVTKGLQEGSVEEGLGAAGRFGASQAIGEGIGLGIHGARVAKRGAAALAAHDAQVTGRTQAVEAQRRGYVDALNARKQQVAQRQAEVLRQKGEFAQAKARHQTMVEADQAQLAAHAATHAERQAAQLADLVKQQVPPWAGLPSTTKGLWRMVYGPDAHLVNEAFDAALRQSVPRPGMSSIQMWIEDARKMKLAPTASGTAQLGSKEMVQVDAHDAAMAVLGRWTKDPGLYNRVIRELDQAGVGDPAARAMYRSAQALRMFADKSQMFEGETFHPDRVQKYLGRLQANQELMRRRTLDLYGQLKQSTPMAPPLGPPVPAPVPPQAPPPVPGVPRPQPIPPVPPSPVTRQDFPIGAEIGGLLGWIAGQRIGHPWWGAGLGWGAGKLVGPSVPFYRGVQLPPAGPLGRAAQRLGPTAAGAGVRATWDFIMQDDPESGIAASQTREPSPSQRAATGR